MPPKVDEKGFDPLIAWEMPQAHQGVQASETA